MGLDIGRKKVGIAFSDQTLTIARHYKTVFFADLKPEIQKHLPTLKGLVIGLPLRMNGSKGEAAEEIIKIGQALSQELNICVFFEDERLTSWEARERLKEMDYSAKKIKELEHQVSAQLILQSFLNGQNPIYSPNI